MGLHVALLAQLEGIYASLACQVPLDLHETYNQA